jgi:ABC-type Mn2+/Zn2+ transport system permease subunit
MRGFVVWAVVLSLFASVVGLWLSYFANASSGGTIVLVATGEFIVIWLATQLRGR